MILDIKMKDYETISLTSLEDVSKIRKYLGKTFTESSGHSLYFFSNKPQLEGYPVIITKEGWENSFVKLDSNHPRFEELKEGIQNLVA